MSSQNTNAFNDNLKAHLDAVELTIVEHHMLRILAERCNASNLYCVQLNCQQLQEITRHKYSIEAIKRALAALHSRCIIKAWIDGSLGLNLFFWEWIMHTRCEQSSGITKVEQGDREL